MKNYIHVNGRPIMCAHRGDAGGDLVASESAIVPAGGVRVVNTGAYVGDDLTEGLVAKVCSRSGLASRGVWVANAPGIVDSGYRGEIGVILFNSTGEDFHVEKGDRIAQVLIEEYKPFTSAFGFERGDGGFGSTGD